MPKPPSPPISPNTPIPDSARAFLDRLKSDFPDLVFKTGKKFAYRPPRTIIYEEPPINTPPPENYALLTLHELAHAILKHKDYKLDVERLKIESAAWYYVKSALAPRYKLPYADDFVEDRLDTYRNWLHRRSLCPLCHSARYQDHKNIYHCPFCHTSP